MKNYYNEIWREKLSLKQYSSLEARWRTRWDFAQEKIPSGSKVLDAACGDGVLGEFLIKEKDCSVYGLDISDYALERARDRGLKTFECNLSLERFPFEDEFFDAVVFACSIEHLMFPEKALNEAYRVLKNKGLLIVTLPNVANFKNRLSFLRGQTSEDFLHINPGEDMHFKFYNYKDEFEKLTLSKIPGFCIIEKGADLKNPNLHSNFMKWIYQKVLIKAFPNLFGEYTHWLIEKGA